MRVLITRPQEDAVLTAKALVARGHEALIAPLFSIVAMPFAWPATPAVLLATSANALRMAGVIPAEHLKMPLFTVGDATAAAAHAAGFTTVYSANGDSEALAALVMQMLPAATNLLYLAGYERRDVALQKLSRQYAMTTLEVYEMKAAEQLPQAIYDAIAQGKLDAVLHFSPRSAKIFADLMEQADTASRAQGILHVCISQAACDARFANNIIAANPRQEAMLDALVRP